jgi:hypothetical protein
MKDKRWRPFTGRLGLVIGIALWFGLAPGLVTGADGIDPEADRILKSMSSYLGATGAFSVDADIDFEIVTNSGQKLQLSSYAKAVLKRPDKFHIRRKGMITDAEFVFDGEALTLFGRNLNVYSRTEGTGTIDDAIRAYELETGITAPGADLLFEDPYAILSSDVVSSAYLGIAYVNGVACHHLAFREDRVDWQLWVRAGDEPMPMKYVITSKWHTASPQYEIRFRNWNTTPRINADQFRFSVPEGARRLETIIVNEMGEFILEEDKR